MDMVNKYLIGLTKETNPVVDQKQVAVLKDNTLALMEEYNGLLEKYNKRLAQWAEKTAGMSITEQERLMADHITPLELRLSVMFKMLTADMPDPERQIVAVAGFAVPVDSAEQMEMPF